VNYNKINKIEIEIQIETQIIFLMDLIYLIFLEIYLDLKIKILEIMIFM